MTKIQRIVCMALLLTGVVAASACFSINGIRNEAQDRAEIKQLMWRYARALDTGDAEAYAATFAPDGQFGRGDDATRGREELKKMIQDLQKPGTETEATGVQDERMYHIFTNSYIEFIDGENARLHAYWMTVFAESGENAAVRVAAAGREYNELVRSDGKWLIKLRDVNSQD
jgi:uncharacterized protein (TIGR02246 family)